MRILLWRLVGFSVLWFALPWVVSLDTQGRLSVVFVAVCLLVLWNAQKRIENRDYNAPR